MWMTALVIVLAVCLALCWTTVKPKRFPPGPKWLPVIGSALELYKMREKTGYLYKALAALSSKYCNNGPVLGLKIGQDWIVTVNSLEANKEMLSNEDFDGRPKGIFYRTRIWGETNLGVLLTDGELWKENRKFLVKHLKEFGFGRKGMADTACLEATYMVKHVRQMLAAGENTCYMHNFFNTYILNTLWMMMAGLRYEPNDPQMILLQGLLFDLFAAVDMVGATFSHFPILTVIAPNLSGYREFVKTHQRLWKYLKDEITNHKMRFDPNKEDRDFMDVYLRLLTEKGATDLYSEGQLLATCMDMFMAGTETTSKTMGFGFSYIVRDQEVQRRAQEEIDRVVGRDRPPCLEDRSNMPYNEAMLFESLRHFMGRTLGVPHRAVKNSTIAGFYIPKDTMVVTNFTNILMDPNLFPDPNSFKPDRFLVNGKVSLPDHFFPFGLSRHRCMGDILAKCNMFVFATTMLQNFSFLPVPGEPLPSLNHVDGATPSAAPFKALIVPR